MRFLFFKEHLAWPRSSGHDVHSYHLMRALGELGHPVGLLTVSAPRPEATAEADLEEKWLLSDFQPEGKAAPSPRQSYLQKRFCSYYGIADWQISAVAAAAATFRADVVVVVGLHVLPYLSAVRNARRVWYAADEWVRHHLSQVSRGDPDNRENLIQAAVKGLYERAFATKVDRIWVVSATERRAMRWVTGLRAVDVVPNGVDGEHYRPIEASESPRSCVFWGRLDFGPNIQALRWFCTQVWPLVLQRVPDAVFRIFGFQPGPAVRDLAIRPNVELATDLPDIRVELCRQAIAVLPFLTGGGIKNKLLEACSLGRAVICSRQACQGLAPGYQSVLRQASAPDDWVNSLEALWADPGSRSRMGSSAREWVLKNHSWPASARKALLGLRGHP